MRQSGGGVGTFVWSVCYALLSATICSALILAPLLERPAFAQGAPPPSPYPPPPPASPYPPAPPAPPGAQPAPGYPPGAYPPPPMGAPYPYAHPGDITAAVVAGTRDAEADMNGAIWFLAGCGLTWIGIILAYVIEPTPPASRLMGKSPEYLAAYTSSYKAAGKSAQAKQAIIGCVVSVAVILAFYAFLFFVIVSESQSSNGGGF